MFFIIIIFEKKNHPITRQNCMVDEFPCLDNPPTTSFEIVCISSCYYYTKGRPGVKEELWTDKMHFYVHLHLDY